MDIGPAQPTRFFPVSAIGGKLLPHPGRYVPEDRLDAMLDAEHRDGRKIRSAAALDDALHRSRATPLESVTLWVVQGLESEVLHRQRGG